MNDIQLDNKYSLKVKMNNLKKVLTVHGQIFYFL